MRKRNRPSVAAVTPTPESHAHARVWGALPGECGVECSCGLLFDGFETRIAARNAHWDHYLDSIDHPAWCVREVCGEGGADLHGTPDRRVELPEENSVIAWLQQRHGDADDQGVMLAIDSSTGFAELSVEQAKQLRDNLNALITAATGELTGVDEVVEAYRVGREVGHEVGHRDAFALGLKVGQMRGEVGHIRGTEQWAKTNRKPRTTTVPVNPRRAPKSTDCKIPAQKRVTAAVGAA